MWPNRWDSHNPLTHPIALSNRHPDNASRIWTTTFVISFVISINGDIVQVFHTVCKWGPNSSFFGGVWTSGTVTGVSDGICNSEIWLVSHNIGGIVGDEPYPQSPPCDLSSCGLRCQRHCKNCLIWGSGKDSAQTGLFYRQYSSLNCIQRPGWQTTFSGNLISLDITSRSHPQ